jgi:PqqA peptide cyclase
MPALAPPSSVIAELTHRCPLHCLYCSNPIEMARADAELPTGDWKRVIDEAAALGVLHFHFTGGEPLVRRDLEELIAHARAAGLYTNMVSSCVGLSEQRLDALVRAGLDHLQLSLQDVEESSANHIAGARAHQLKLAIAPVLRRASLAFTLNLVVHRLNLDRIEQMLALAEELGPDRLEIAHVQYYGWALKNRSLLMPTREQVERSLPIIEGAQQRLRGRMHVSAVFPDYYGSFPKACVGGWGRQTLLVAPGGEVLPCHSAAAIPGLHFDSVRTRALDAIWRDSEAFERFRGDAWMPAACQSCERKEVDFGGCRCQALLLTGDAAAMDPVCHRSPDHPLLAELRAPQAAAAELLPIWR